MAINKRQWKAFRLWLEERQLVGDINGWLCYVSYEDIEDLFKRLYGGYPKVKACQADRDR